MRQNNESNTIGIKYRKDIKLRQHLPAGGAGVIATQNEAKVKMSSCKYTEIVNRQEVKIIGY